MGVPAWLEEEDWQRGEGDLPVWCPECGADVEMAAGTSEQVEALMAGYCPSCGSRVS